MNETISNISKNIDNVYILVGFFYFSGFIKLKEEFKDKNIKILIGLDIDSKVGKFIYEYENIKDKNLENQSISSIKEKFYKSLIKAFNDTDIFEEKNIEDTFRKSFTKYNEIEGDIKKELGDSKPLVAREVAKKLSTDNYDKNDIGWKRLKIIAKKIKNL
jgi:hypothetical protein